MPSFAGDGDDDGDDDDDDDDGYPAYFHQSYSHQVGTCHNDEWWEYDTVNFPPYLYIMISLMMRRWGGVVTQDEWNPEVTPQTFSRHPPR